MKGLADVGLKSGKHPPELLAGAGWLGCSGWCSGSGAHTHLVLRESLDDALHLFRWDIELLIDEPVDEPEEEPEIEV